MRSSATPDRRRDAGFTALEVVIATTILAVAFALSMATFVEGTNAARTLTVDSELRARGNHVLERLARDLRSSQPGQVSATANAISFYTITGSSAGAPTFSATRATYSWNPAETRLIYRPPVAGAPASSLTGEVESFTVSPAGASFPNAAPLTLDITLTLRRDGLRATARAKVTVPRGT